MNVDFFVLRKNDGSHKAVHRVNRINLILFVGCCVESPIELADGGRIQSKSAFASEERHENYEDYRFFAITRSAVEYIGGPHHEGNENVARYVEQVFV